MVGVVAGAMLAAGASAAVGVPVADAANPLANPPANRAAPALASNTGNCTHGTGATLHCQSPCYPQGKFVYNASKSCTDLLLAAINAAQVSEHLNGFTLPSNYFQLSATKQLFVLVNLERISRSVPPLTGLAPSLNAEATSAAERAQDPTFQTSYGPIRVWFPPAGGTYAFGGAWAGDSVNAADAVFGWFYNDGWGGKGDTWNFACTSSTASGCWGHRDELLGEWAGTGCTDCVAGSGYASPAADNWQESYDFVLVRPVHFPTPMTYTWDADVVPYLPAGWERAQAP